VMDYIDGRSLAEIVKAEGPMSEARALGYIRQVCAALHYVHSQNRLHLDIKPNNIMVTGNNRAILIDFGVSKQYDEASGENTSTLLGCTPGYAPPEQMSQNIKHFYPATDVYSLGATLYDLLTGEAPPDAAKRISGIEELAPLSARISTTTRTAINCALALNKNQRPQSVAAFAALLDSGEAYQPASKPKPDGETEKLVEKPTSPWYKRYTALIVIAAVAVVVGVIALLSGGSNETEYLDEDTVASIVEFGDTAVATIDVSEYTPQPQQTPQAQQVQEQPVKPEPTTPQPARATTGSYNGHDWVDLGLSVKWATCNVGASSPSGYGDYYAWGEVSTKTEYTEENSRTYKNSNYNFNICGNSSYDVARYKWGSPWRLPSKSEIEELVDNCTWEWTTMNGINGYKVKSKKNSNYIFLPAAGGHSGSSFGAIGSDGYYWSGTPDTYYGRAYVLIFVSDERRRDDIYRYFGLSVRPVAE
ncbi:MAG: protein kinase, partial [Muribaculaceae bacterium]